jgi:hypothetical protein
LAAAGVQIRQGIGQQHVGREFVSDQMRRQIAGIVDLIAHNHPRRQRMRSHRIDMDGAAIIASMIGSGMPVASSGKSVALAEARVAKMAGGAFS